MRKDTPQTIYLKDYKPYPYKIGHIDLSFDIHEGYTIVRSNMNFTIQDEHEHSAHLPALFLHGEGLELTSLTYNGADFTEHQTNEHGLTLTPKDKSFTLEIETRIKPEENTRLEGLYKSGDTYCTQCEAEGFRRITYYPDRPDVMTTFTTRIEANKDQYPVLLGNGNRLDHGDLDHGRHFAVWHDPFPKPCYLFALVAGDLTHIEDEFVTKSGRKVELYIYVRPGDEEQCTHAMESLKKSMKWDEDVYGLEYDLDLFNIVAVSDFNMGAMENKSLNIFNTALVLAHQDTATDSDFMRVESVIAHEYFHNWSGNRVTCRDWFQLSLKEGLTVFRDQEFSADLNSRAVQRIDDVSHLQRFQFAEDAGPLAHPIRPDNYIEINNFYTMTVYEKGAEVIRMLRTILGPEKYRAGTDLYFSRHDGDAATCDDFVACMEEVSGQDLSQFKLWYSQAGTPEVKAETSFDKAVKTYTVDLSQSIPDTPGQTNKKPMHMPIHVGLLNEDGEDIADKVLHLTKNQQSFTFDNIEDEPTPSLLRNFSAPVRLNTMLSDEELAFLMRHDTDGFNRWEAAQTYALRLFYSFASSGFDKPQMYLNDFGKILDAALEDNADKALMARMISIPDLSIIGQHIFNHSQGEQLTDPQSIYENREALIRAILEEHKPKLERLLKENQDDGDYEITPQGMGKRALKNAAMLMLCNHRTKDDAALLVSKYEQANNMTDRMATLFGLVVMDTVDAADAVEDFYNRFKKYPLVVDKWFSAQAMAVLDDTVPRLKKLRQHKEFNIQNPNRVRSLYAAFAMNNPVCFHKDDGSGYDFLTDAIIELNTINPQIAARLLTPMREWRRYTSDRQEKMKTSLERILSEDNLSPDVYEIASKSIK